MDIQFVLDSYAVASYVVSYMMKAQRGMSRLMQRAYDEARRGNKDVKEALRHMGNTFIRAQEICAQEAVYLTMGLKLRDSSRTSSLFRQPLLRIALSWSKTTKISRLRIRTLLTYLSLASLTGMLADL